MALTDLIISIILEPLASAIIGIFLERRFKIIQKIRKMVAYLLNSPIELKVVFTLKSQDSPKEIGKKIADMWKSQGLTVTVTKDNNNYYAITNGTYNIDLGKIEDEIVLQTSVLDTVMRKISDKFSEILKLLENLQNIKIIETSLLISLPYKFEFVEIKPTSSLFVSDYDIKLGANKWKSQLSLKLKNKNQQLEINGKNNSEIYDIVNKLFRLI
jgi:hypothetical protein